MTFKNTVFYVEDGKFYISRHVLIAIFRLLIGSQRPDSWHNDLLLSRFERSIAFYPKEKAGIFFPVFERAASVPIENWILTDVPLPRLETLYPQLSSHPDELPNIDNVNDDNDSTLGNSAPAIFFSATPTEPASCWKQRPKFRFSDFDIPSGSVLTFKRDPSITVTTLDEKTGVVSDDYEVGSSWTDITRQLSGFPQVAPIDYWCYNGTPLRKMYDAKYGDNRKKKASKKAVPLTDNPPQKSENSPSQKSGTPPPILNSSFGLSPSAPALILTSPGH